MANGFRRKLLWLHTWTGITVGFVLLLFALTGAALAMRDRVDARLMSHLTHSSSCANARPLETLVDQARARLPREELKAVNIGSQPGSSISVEFHNDDLVYFDACNGRMLGIENEYGGFSGTMDWIHRFHFMESGRLVGGVFNLAILLFLVLGGIILWWPSSRAALRSRITYNAKLPKTARLLSLHRVTGIYAFVLLLLLTLTALPISFGWGKSLIATATGSSTAAPKPPEAKSVKGPALSFDQIRQRALGEMPSAQLISINAPKKAGGVLRLEVLEAGAPHINAESYLFLDPVTGETLKRARYATEVPLGRKVYLYFIALHAGLIGGLGYQLLLLACCLLVPVQFYSGVVAYFGRWGRGTVPRLKLRLVERRQETPSIAIFEFEHCRGRPLPPFTAGAHIDIHLEGGLTRQYSLCNPPHETHRYIIAVQLAEASRGGSRQIHEALWPAQVVETSVPRNHFELAREAPQSLLIAGGIGITPILCMAERLAVTRAPFDLIYCFRDREGAAFLDRLASSSFARQTKLHESGVAGRIDTGALLEGLRADTHIYVCGPASLNDAVIAAARARGWPEDHLHREYFAAADIDRSGDGPFDVCIASTGERIQVPADQSVIEALAGHGIVIPSSCSEGTCGTCLTRVLQGEIEHRDVLLTEEERRRGDHFTPCCSRARSGEIVLDL